MHIETISLIPGRDDVTLTTYVIDDSPEMLAGRRRPAVLVLPGGAYLGCSDREGEPVALAFAALGYHAFVLRYSTYGEGRPFGGAPLAVDAPKPHLTHPAPVLDVGRAVLAVRARADEWLVDVDRIAVAGFSAGGHNAAMYATHWHRPLLTEALGVPAEQLRPAAAVLGYALTDYTQLRPWMLQVGAGPDLLALMRQADVALLGTADPDEAALRSVSPALHVDAATPATFLWATSADGLVPAHHTLAMAQALAVAGVPYEVHVLGHGDHGLSLATQATATAWSQTDPALATWFDDCARWLQRRFALPLPARMDWEIAAGRE